MRREEWREEGERERKDREEGRGKERDNETERDEFYTVWKTCGCQYRKGGYGACVPKLRPWPACTYNFPPADVKP